MFEFGTVIDKSKANLMNPVVLAFVGDAVYSLYVREKLSCTTDYKTGKLNTFASAEVNATSQANLVKELLPLFTEEEADIYKRARNSKKATKSKHSSVCDYNMSTGFEAVLGYLYLIGNYERLNFILNRGNNNEG